mgnify:CR=1 FL=1
MEQDNYSSNLISVEEILKSKFGPKVPGFLVRITRRLLHEDFVNEVLRTDKRGIEFTDRVMEKCRTSLTVEGLDNVPKDGYYTIASNHPLGGNDALLLLNMVGHYFDGNVKTMVNDFLMALKPLSDLFVPVNKVGGSQARNLSAMTEALFSSPSQVLIFPAGKCSRRINGKIQDIPWTKTFITKSAANHRDIVPVHFYGRNSWRFYALDAIGKLLKLKFPLAMILLVDEMYRAMGRSYRVVVGKPIPWQTFDRSRTPLEWAAYVRDTMYAL